MSCLQMLYLAFQTGNFLQQYNVYSDLSRPCNNGIGVGSPGLSWTVHLCKRILICGGRCPHASQIATQLANEVQPAGHKQHGGLTVAFITP